MIHNIYHWYSWILMLNVNQHLVVPCLHLLVPTNFCLCNSWGKWVFNNLFACLYRAFITKHFLLVVVKLSCPKYFQKGKPHFGLKFRKMWVSKFLCQRCVLLTKTVLMCTCLGKEYPINVYRANFVYLDCNYRICSISI